MIFPSNRVRIFVAARAVDFRKGHDGLAALIRNELRKDQFTGTVFVFRSKRADRAKILFWDGSGLVIVYKRLEDHKSAWPRSPLFLNQWRKMAHPRRHDEAEPCTVRGPVRTMRRIRRLSGEQSPRRMTGAGSMRPTPGLQWRRNSCARVNQARHSALNSLSS